MWRAAARYEPSMGEDERDSLLADWHRALERSRGWARAADRRVTEPRGTGVASDCRAAALRSWQT